MKNIYLTLLAAILLSSTSYAQTEVSPGNGPMGSVATPWLRFGQDATSVQEYWGLNLTGSNVQPVKVVNTSFMVGYTSANQDFGIGNAFISGKVGIGTNNPLYSLDVQNGVNGDASLLRLYNNESSFSYGHGSSILFANQDGREYARIGGYTETDNSGANGYIGFSTRSNEVNSEKMRISSAGSVGIGTITPDPSYKLSVNGNIRTKEVKVETGWADYVFKKDYQLKTLPEVEAYIAKNSHLPDVPSEAEVKKNGVNVGETESLLLKKIEELTLYLIEKDKEVKTQAENATKQDQLLKAQAEKNLNLEVRLRKVEALLVKGGSN